MFRNTKVQMVLVLVAGGALGYAVASGGIGSVKSRLTPVARASTVLGESVAAGAVVAGEGGDTEEAIVGFEVLLPGVRRAADRTGRRQARHHVFSTGDRSHLLKNAKPPLAVLAVGNATSTPWRMATSGWTGKWRLTPASPQSKTFGPTEAGSAASTLARRVVQRASGEAKPVAFAAQGQASHQGDQKAQYPLHHGRRHRLDAAGLLPPPGLMVGETPNIDRIAKEGAASSWITSPNAELYTASGARCAFVTRACTRCEPA